MQKQRIMNTHDTFMQRCLDLGHCADNDKDSDGILDINDNCMREYNPDQADLDGNGVGNVCDYVAYWIMDPRTPKTSCLCLDWCIGPSQKSIRSASSKPACSARI